VISTHPSLPYDFSTRKSNFKKKNRFKRIIKIEFDIFFMNFFTLITFKARYSQKK
jgi:hypothetical protein